ncbi:MAG: type II toxin-antitoxin system HicA family toxin [Methanomicrobium sp.]|nr:type II toxin-antitoxin system HicA family toxin [Methanomicrobium sp.]
MPKLPVLSYLEVIKALNKTGYNIDHQTGSHIILRQDKEPYRRFLWASSTVPPWLAMSYSGQNET